MVPNEDFASVFARARTGSSEALAALYIRYAPHVREVVRRRLARPMRSRLDSVDCAQDVWLSLLKASVERLDFPDERSFLAYLTRMAVNKLGEEARRQTTRRSDRRREKPIVVETEPPARQPTPSQAALADERWAGLIGELPPAQREMVAMLRDGYTHEEIGRRLGVHKKTVQRLLQRLRDQA